MAKRASIPLLLLAALIGSAAAAPRAPLALHVLAALACGSVRALVARPRYVRRPVTRLRSTIDDTDIEVDARILQAKQDLLERVYAGEAGIPVGEPPVLVNADPCDEEAIICEVDEDVSDPGHVTSFSAAAAPARAMTAAAAIPLPDKEVVFMDALKETVDVDGIAGTVGDGIALLFGDTVRRRLWTRADYAHIHAVSGAYFMVLGFLWLFTSHALLAMDPAAPLSWHLDKPLEASIVLMGAVNAVSAVPMARFSSNKLLDMSDLKANGFTFGGAGLTLMSCWCAWWFSGGYPSFLLPAGPLFFLVWTLVCVGTTVNWEVMLQQNFEANSEGGSKKAIAGQRKLKKMSQDELNEKALLYRLASWPNLTQLLFLYSISTPDAAVWWAQVTEQYPLQGVMLYHYGYASALGYALSMFSETLRDRKLVSLRVDLIILLIGVFLPMVSVAFDAACLGDAVTIKPWEYWRQFQGW
mmetsp:Transcript_23195/g.60382  ORF Transcript_23195/g.60382 Transcript_23195/m.60382 type:complete len:470 (-) Transcript_23195:66-1475(-)